MSILNLDKFFIIYIYIFIISVISFIIMVIDKKRAIKKKWRIKENTLISLGIIGGAPGVLIAMVVLKHKLSKKKFYFGIPIIYLLESLLIIILNINNYI